MDLTTILDDCLERLKAGETIANCLTRYSSQAVALAPMLTAAVQVQSLAPYRLSDAQRLRAKMTLRETLAGQSTRRATFLDLLRMGQPRQWVTASLAALFLLVVLSVSTVAASQPGDLAYPVRVAVERAPAALVFDPGARADIELNAADRRLADVRYSLERAPGAVPAVLAALISGDEAAAAQATAFSTETRAVVAERVALHAATLTQLADVAIELDAAELLSRAASRTRLIAEQLRASQPSQGGAPPDRPQPALPSLTPPPTVPEVRPGASETPTATPTPAAASAEVDGTASPTPPPGRRPFEQTPSSGTPHLPPPVETRAGRATEIVATITALPPHAPPPPVATRQAERTAEPSRLPTVERGHTPPPAVETRQSAQTPSSPPPAIETRQAEPPRGSATSAPGPAPDTGNGPVNPPGSGGNPEPRPGPRAQP